jgi:hypothetical protein
VDCLVPGCVWDRWHGGGLLKRDDSRWHVFKQLNPEIWGGLTSVRSGVLEKLLL